MSRKGLLEIKLSQGEPKTLPRECRVVNTSLSLQVGFRSLMRGLIHLSLVYIYIELISPENQSFFCSLRESKKDPVL